MQKRIISAVIGFPIMAVFVAVGNSPLQIGLFVLGVIGMREMYLATLTDKNSPLPFIAYAFAAVYYFMIGYVGSGFPSEFLLVFRRYFSNLFLIFSALFIIVLMIALVVLYERVSFIDCAVVLSGFFHVAFLLSFIYLVRQYTYGQLFVWLIFISAWGCDTCAYFTGITLGRHKLTPRLSPKKTVEGAIGGVIGAALLAAVYGFAVSKMVVFDDIQVILFCTISGGVGAVFAQFGDLAASALKRATGIKDYGMLIPGHGGIIDRFDSVLFTAPVVYMVMFTLINFYR